MANELCQPERRIWVIRSSRGQEEFTSAIRFTQRLFFLIDEGGERIESWTRNPDADLDTPWTAPAERGPVDWDEMKRRQDEQFPNMRHADPCVCTQMPNGFIMDYDCAAQLARQEQQC